MLTTRPTTCPRCGGPQVHEILWGMIVGEEFERAQTDPDVTWGGCGIIDTAWAWDCATCGNQWGDAAGSTAD